MTRFLLTLFLLQVPSDELLFNKIDLLVRQGQLTAAENTAREYVQTHSNSADGHFLLGYVLFAEAKAKESLAEYTEGAKYRVPGARDLKVVASDYVILSDFADADKWFTKVVEWTPQDVQAWYDLGRTKYNENRFEEAISAFQKTLALDPSNVKAEDNLGLSYGALEKTEEAIAAYQRAIALVPGYADAHYNLALAYERQGLRRRALRHWLNYVRLDPVGPWASHAKAQAKRILSTERLSIVSRSGQLVQAG